ncbi:MAG: TauD/TfdA family dioxygenase, partial [Chloroflexi bacterium]|nr:TauD/TfdA family dioxygenase [Chloroflexota bacterium]
MTNNANTPKPSGKKLGVTRRQAISADVSSLIKTSEIQPGQNLPLVIEPAVEGVDLIEWGRSQRAFIAGELVKHGGILFRGFGIAGTEGLERFTEAISGELLEYQDRATPRSQVSGNIYTSTDYPADQTIELHNEMAYASVWPRKILFCCVTAAKQGGETPIADCRGILKRIDPELRERLIAKQLMYERNFGDKIGISWQQAFNTDDKAVMAEFCRQNQIEFEWKDANHLQTRQIRPAVIQHPETGEQVWFNQATAFHASTLEPEIRDALLAEFGEHGLPKNVFYGDGSSIDTADLQQIRAAYQQETIAFPWQEGDVLLLDNILVAH